MASVIAVTVDVEPQRSDIATDVIEIPSDIKWSDFELVLRVAFGLESTVVKYIDEEADAVTIGSDDELREAFRVALTQNNTLHIKLCNAQPTIVSPPRPEGATFKPSPGLAQSVTMATRDAVSISSGASSDESITMEAAESNKDSMSSPESSLSRCFFLRHMASNLVLDVEGWQRTAGTRVILYQRKRGSGLHGCENQLFMEDEETGTIRSYFCGLCLDATENGLTIQPFSPGKLSQRWKLDGNKLENGDDRPDWVIGVDEAGSRPMAMLYEAKTSQHWAKDYNIASNEDDVIHMLLPIPHTMTSHTSKHKVDLYTELAREMAVHLSHPEGATAGGEATNAPRWFTDYMEQFKKDLCEEISSLVTQKTVTRILNGLMEGHSGPSVDPPGPASLDYHQQQQLVHHFGVVCDNCEMPINGVRYKCGNCDDYDLCAACETKITESGSHDTDHVFLKIRRPAMAFPRRKSGTPAPLLKRSLYPTDEEIQRIQEKMLRKQEKYRRRGEKHEEKLKRREDKLKRRHEFLREIPSKKEKLEFPLMSVPFEKFDANFVRDENYPDGSELLPDVRITKRWLMSNTGSHAWTEQTKLTLMWGNIPVEQEEVVVPPLQPKEEGIIAVNFSTPAHPGVYQSHWRMSHKNVRFGHRVWCSIVVVPLEDTPPALVECTKREEGEVKMEKEGEVKVGKEGEQEEPSQGSEVAQPPPADEDVIIDVETVEETVVKETGEKEEVETTERTVPEKNSSVEADIMSAQDILSFELLDIRDRNTPKVSQTATPTNTPMAMTPPKSPVREMEGEEAGFRHLSTSSSVEIVSESSEESTSHMTELVQERIAKLGLKPDHRGEDIETVSTCSEDSDSDSDFYIVPLPDCFNPNLPLSASTSTSVVMTREEVQKTVDDILTASKNLDTPALVPETVDLTREEENEEEEEGSMVHVKNDNTSDDVSLLALETSMTEVPPEEVTKDMSPAPESQTVTMETVPAPLSAPVLNAPPEITTDENANSVPSTPEGATPFPPPLAGGSTETGMDLTQSPAQDQTLEEGQGQTVGGAIEEAMLENPAEGSTGETEAEPEGHGAAGQSSNDGEVEVTRPAAIDIPPRQATSSSSTPHTPPSPSVLASTLMTAAIGVATQAAATAYTTAKDVFHTLQASKEYVPPKSNWKPSAQKWTPPKQDFTLPKETWTPPSQEWTPPDQEWTPPTEGINPLPTQIVSPQTPPSEMEQLVEMGFADRELNAVLLKKYKKDVQKVVQELVNRQDNEWHQVRH